MNNFCTFFRKLSKSDKIAKKDLKDISNLAKAVVKDDLGDYAKFLVCNWHENNDPWIDFNFALRPDWVVGTPDDKQIKMRVSIDLSDNSWYVYMIVDCQYGECEDWGEKEFNSEELESCTECVRYMLEAIHGQYDKKLHEENAKSGTASRELFDILESGIESQHDFEEQREAIDGLIVEYLATTYPEAVFVGSDIDLNICRKVLHINFDVNNRKYQIRFKAWGCGARSVWVELRGSATGSVKLENHADLPDIARKLAGTSPEASKAPAGDSPLDRIGQLEARVAELENTIRKLLKK